MTNNYKPILYGTVTSPTVRAVLLTLKALKVDFDFRVVNVLRGENLSGTYQKMNPAHTIPTLEIEPGRYIGDSHAIMAYLVGKYSGNDDSLYPKDLYKRAKVDELLHFENGILFIKCVKQSLWPIFQGLRKDVPAEKIKEIVEAYDMLEAYFDDHAFVAGEQMTIADFGCFTSMTSLIPIKQFDDEKYPKICAWLAHMSSLPYYEEIMENEAIMKTGDFLIKTLHKL